MKLKTLLRNTILLTVLVPSLAGALAVSHVCAQDKPANVKDHQTTPGAQYQPQQDVLSQQPLEQPGAKPGVPTLTPDEFKAASKIYFER